MLPIFEPRGQGEMSSFSHFLTLTHLLSFSVFFFKFRFFSFPTCGKSGSAGSSSRKAICRWSVGVGQLKVSLRHRQTDMRAVHKENHASISSASVYHGGYTRGLMAYAVAPGSLVTEHLP